MASEKGSSSQTVFSETDLGLKLKHAQHYAKAMIISCPSLTDYVYTLEESSIGTVIAHAPCSACTDGTSVWASSHPVSRWLADSSTCLRYIDISECTLQPSKLGTRLGFLGSGHLLNIGIWITSVLQCQQFGVINLPSHSACTFLMKRLTSIMASTSRG